jgi:Raf kinase inhibitor-like YbhB/YbcL family protein
MKIVSPAFRHEGSIPVKYTCDGANISPPLQFGEVPPDAGSLALVVEDPDAPAGTFVHWVVYNIPTQVKNVQEDTEPGIIGMNDYSKAAYNGPCPPSGRHRYFFRLYALDNWLELAPGGSKQELEAVMKNHIIAEAEIIGMYERR